MKKRLLIRVLGILLFIAFSPGTTLAEPPHHLGGPLVAPVAVQAHVRVVSEQQQKLRGSDSQYEAAAREEARRDREVHAQERAASLARDALTASNTQMWLTAFGTVFLACTLAASFRSVRLAAQANKQAQAAFMATERPWVLVTKAELRSSIYLDEHRFEISYALTVRNVGKTVASHVSPSSVVTIERLGSLSTLMNPLRQQGQQQHLQRVAVNLGHLLAPGTEIVQVGRCTLPVADVVLATPEEDRDIRPFIVACVTYNNAATGTLHQSGASFWVHRGFSPSARIYPREVGLLWIKDGTVAAEEFEVEPFGTETFAN